VAAIFNLHFGSSRWLFVDKNLWNKEIKISEQILLFTPMKINGRKKIKLHVNHYGIKSTRLQ
jgi:hypothetical protein